MHDLLQLEKDTGLFGWCLIPLECKWTNRGVAPTFIAAQQPITKSYPQNHGIAHTGTA